MTLCCWDGSGTCIRRAPPMAGWGTSPSPPISLDVSTITCANRLHPYIPHPSRHFLPQANQSEDLVRAEGVHTTRFFKSSDRMRAISRITVVLPTPGRPRKRTEFGTEDSKSAQQGCLISLPTLAVKKQRSRRGLTIEDVTDHVYMASDSPTNTTGQTHNCALATSHRTDPVQGPLDPCSIVTAKVANGILRGFQVIPRNLHDKRGSDINTTKKVFCISSPSPENPEQSTSASRRYSPPPTPRKRASGLRPRSSTTCE